MTSFIKIYFLMFGGKELCIKLPKEYQLLLIEKFFITIELLYWREIINNQQYCNNILRYFMQVTTAKKKPVMKNHEPTRYWEKS